MFRTKYHGRLSPYVFLSPFVFSALVFTAYPLIYSLNLSFMQTDGPQVARYVGLKNFIWIFQDSDFWKACKNTIVFATASVSVQIPASLGLAILLNRRGVRARSLWRMLFFAPALVGMAFVAILASLVFEKNTGLLNTILHGLVGFDLEFPWMERHVMLSLIIASFWMSVGFGMVYFLAALQNIDPSLVDAAMVDGAGPAQQFRHVTMPAIMPVLMFVLLISVVGGSQLFELPYLLLGNGAGPNGQGLTVVMYLYMRGFDQGDLGMASAVGWLLAMLLFTFAILQKRITG